MTPAEKLIASVEMQQIEGAGECLDDDTPYATHEGYLDLMGERVKVYQLNTGERVIEQGDFMRFLGIAKG